MASSHLATAQLHPLVFMSITDVITRHISRGLTTPLVGGLMGQQTRDGITAEHTFDILLLPPSNDEIWEIDTTFFGSRLRQQQEVLKEPVQLEFVGFWTLSPSGADIGTHMKTELAKILPELVKENATPMVLAFHADILAEQMGHSDADGSGSGSSNTGVARMPFTVYEAVQTDPQATAMDSDGDKQNVTVPDQFREIPWEMQTGEAEMIALEFVKTGAGNATRVRTGAGAITSAVSAPSTGDEQGAEPAGNADEPGSKTKSPSGAKTTTAAAAASAIGAPKRSTGDLYTPEQEEMLSFLNTRANAMRTLLARLSVIRDYVAAAGKDPAAASPEIMRAIKALLNRLPGVEQAKKDQVEADAAAAAAATTKTPVVGFTPAGKDGGDQAALAGKTSQLDAVAEDPLTMDANLVNLLGTLGRSIANVRELGGKFHAVDSTRREQRRGGGGMMGGVMSAGMESRFSEADMMDLT